MYIAFVFGLLLYIFILIFMVSMTVHILLWRCRWSVIVLVMLCMMMWFKGSEDVSIGGMIGYLVRLRIQNSAISHFSK